MKESIFFCLILLVLIRCSTLRENKTIEIGGSATLKVEPDIVILDITSVANDLVYSNSVTKVNAITDDIVKELRANGFTQLKSHSFSVNKIRDYRNENLDQGYSSQQNITVEFQVNKDLINRAIKLLSASKMSSEFNFTFQLSSKRKKEIESQLIQEALKNATVNMELLAKTGQFSVGKILHVKYHNSSNFSPPVPTDKAVQIVSENHFEFSGIEISEIEMNDNVSVVWEIK